ncbi:MAG: MFS transporter [Acidimicrobiaceae bacterium]|nr:MFS transporter [Acidimicrobiaceae bacterium]
MTVLRVVRRGSAAEMERERAARREARSDIVAERAIGEDRFEARDGPFRDYARTLSMERTGPGGAGTGEAWQLTETTSYRLAVPVWAWLFHFPVRSALRRRRDTYGYWWAPPDRLSARAATVLGLLCTIQVVDGYLGTVLTATLTFAADEFGRGNTAQGVLMGVVRAGVLIALVTAALADRHGRKRLLQATGLGSCLITAVGAAAPGLWFLGGTQLVARGLSTALGILIVILAAEEMPARSRAWAMSVLVLCAALGSGMAFAVLPMADLHISGWRLVYVVPLAGVAVVVWVGRRLPESRRFETASTGRVSHDGVVVDRQTDPEVAARRRKRLVLLAASAFLIAMFAAPASGLRNDFLKDEREFSATAITLFTYFTNTPIGIGIFVGGYLADRRGRRPTGATGLALGAVFIAWAFFTDGAVLWLLTLAGGVVGAIAVPALAVYGPELFGTHRRGRSNGVIVMVGVVGSALGLIVAGGLSDALDGRLAPALALLAVGPLIVAALVILKYPETVGQELEEINPEDLNPDDH